MIANNLDLFKETLNNIDPPIDPYYIDDELIITSDNHSVATSIMNLQIKVVKRISAAAIALEDKTSRSFDKQVSEIDSLLYKEKNANLLEFSSFFPVLDTNFSIYESLEQSKRIQFLRTALKEFISKRHDLYLAHGYSPTTLQVRKDFERHKSKGPSGQKKISKILEHCQYKEYDKDLKQSKWFCAADTNDGEEILKELSDTWEAGDFPYDVWKSSHQGKMADLIWKNQSGYFICEAKHVKEGGGGQYKQLTEIIEFINVLKDIDSKDIYHVSFLDGIYYKELVDPNDGTKPHKQKKGIESALKGNSNAFFVNTFGLHELLKKT